MPLTELMTHAYQRVPSGRNGCDLYCQHCGQKVFAERKEMKTKEGERESEDWGFHVICGTSPKNGISGLPTPKSYGEGNVLDLGGMKSLLVADLDYFVENHKKVLEIVKGQIEKRGHFREHPEELEGVLKRRLR